MRTKDAALLLKRVTGPSAARHREVYLFPIAGVALFGFISFLNSGSPIDRSVQSYLLPLSMGAGVGLAVALLKKVIDAKNRRAQEFFLSLIESLATALDERDPYTHGHSRRVTALSLRLGLQRHLSFSEMEQLRMCGILHDIGKIGIRDDVLLKNMKLTDAEFCAIKEHPIKGARILEGLQDARMNGIVACVKHHHERWDGLGYPDGLRREDIPLFARIVAIVDAYDAMTSDRPYRKGMSAIEAMDNIKKASGSQFDPELVLPFVEMLHGKRELGTCPKLDACPIFRRIAEDEISKAYEMQYCRAGYEACERFVLSAKKKNVPPGLLPDGGKLE